MFKERLKVLRSKKGITQEELATRLDVPASTIRRYESVEDGLPRRNRLEAIAEFFNCSVDYLIGRTTNPNPYDGGAVNEQTATYESKQPEVEEYYRELARRYNINIHDPANREKLEKLVKLFFEEYNSDK